MTESKDSHVPSQVLNRKLNAILVFLVVQLMGIIAALLVFHF
ncbi:MAG: hypothetical protein WA110_05785 [Anaerolineaceae bacterium]